MSNTETTAQAESTESVESTVTETVESDGFDVEAISEESIADLSDADLEKLRKQTIDTESDTEDQSTEGSESGTEEKPGSKEEKSEKPKTDQMSDSERIASLEKQVQDLEKIKNDRGDFIEKQNTVIGSLKSQINDLSAQKTDLDRKTTNQNFWENPKEALQAERDKEKVNQKLESATRELKYRENKSAIASVVPDYESEVDNIVEYLKVVDPPREVEVDGKKIVTGTTDEIVAQFKKDPYVIPAQKAVEFTNAARMYKKSQLYKEKAEILEGKPKQVLDKVNQAANYRTATSKPSGTDDNTASEVTDEDIERMSDEELTRFIESAKKSVG